MTLPPARDMREAAMIGFDVDPALSTAPRARPPRKPRSWADGRFACGQPVSQTRPAFDGRKFRECERAKLKQRAN